MPASPTDLLPLEAAVIRDFTDQTKGLAINDDGSVNVKTPAEQVVTTLVTNFDLAATGTTNVATPAGYNTVSVTVTTPSFSGTLNVRYSVDNGVTFGTVGLMCQVRNSTSIPTNAITAGGGLTYDAPIPPEATHIQVYVASLASGTVTGKVTISPRVFSPPQTVWAYLSASSSRIGSVYASEVHYQDTTTALITGTPTFSATIRDCKNAGSGAVAGAASYAKTYSVIACGDKTFDLFVYISENGLTLYKAYKVSATQVDSGLYVAEITITPKMRWAQAQAALTGGVSMTQFTMATSMFAN